MIKKLFIAATIFTELFTFKLWLTCHDFKYFFHYSTYDLTLQLEDAVHNDKGVPLLIVRFFHNKIIGFLIHISTNYLHFWDIRFAANFFSIVGYFAIVYGFWWFLNNKKKSLFISSVVFLLLLLPAIEIFFYSRIQYVMRLVLLTVPYFIFSVFGIKKYADNSKTVTMWIFFVGLLLLSLWWFYVLKNDMYNYCIKTS